MSPRFRHDPDGEHARPFLKWAGGKRQLLPELLAHVRRLPSFRAYHEPFVGGGALFFAMKRQGMLRGEVHLSDTNPRLIEAYRGIARHVDEVVALLHDHAVRHSKEHYYAVRSTLPDGLAARAARIVYLNRTCFNGLYRENSRGGFNVPMGRYTNPTICDADLLRAVSEALAGVHLDVRTFEGVLAVARPGDLVYFDPPYVPLSLTASFTAYSKDGFGMDAQERLAGVFATLAGRGVHVMLSNSKTDDVLRMYRDFPTHTVLASRAVNSRADRRGKVEEVIVTSW